jgi:hypothetical protein
MFFLVSFEAKTDHIERLFSVEINHCANSNGQKIKFISSMSLICIDGHIDGDMERKFIDNFSSYYSKIVVNSTGGSARSSLVIGRKILESNMTVIVSNMCASSCANYIFLAGHKKYVSKGAVLIWHGGPKRSNMPKYDYINDIEYRNAAIKVWNEISDQTSEFIAQIGIDGRFIFLNPDKCEIIQKKNWSISKIILEQIYKVEGILFFDQNITNTDEKLREVQFINDKNCI